MLVSRIATENKGFIAITAGHYGQFAIYWCDKDMRPLRVAKVEEWLWATTWDSPLEKGSWELPQEYLTSEEEDIQWWEFKPTAIFGDVYRQEFTLLDYGLPEDSPLYPKG